MSSENSNIDDKVIYCRRCGRPLKGFSSRELGFGPRCYSLWKKERNQQMPLFDSKEIDINE